MAERKSCDDVESWEKRDKQEIDEQIGRSRSRIPLPLDGGWGWLVVASSFFINFLVDGICYSFGIIKGELNDCFETNSSVTAFAGSLLAGVSLIIGPIVSVLASTFGCREVCIVGSIIYGLSVAISGFSNNIPMLLITYGILGGIGFGLMYLPATVMVGYYFDKRRALAMGIATCGSGIGTFFLAPLASFLVEEFGWRGTNVIFGGLLLNGMVLAAAYRPIVASKVIMTETQRTEDDSQDNFIMQAIIDGKRRRHFTVDDESLDLVEDKNVSDDESTEVGLATAKNSNVENQQANGNSEPLLSDETENPTLPCSSHSKSMNFVRSRHVTGQSAKSIVVLEEINPMTREDVRYPGSLTKTREYEECGGDLQKYIRSVTISRSEMSGKHISKNSGNNIFTSLFDFSLLKSPTAMLICLSGLLSFTAFYTPFVYIPAKSELLGSSLQRTGLLLAVMGAANTISRVVSGFVADLKGVNCVILHNVAVMMAGVCTCLVSVCDSWELLMVDGALFGIFVAAFVTMRPIVIAHLLGISRLNNALGLLFLFQGTACMFGSPLSGALFDATQSFTLPFIVSGLLLIMAGIVCLPLQRLMKWENSKTRRSSKK